MNLVVTLIRLTNRIEKIQAFRDGFSTITAAKH
jgi:hypothetical protein